MVGTGRFELPEARLRLVDPSLLNLRHLLRQMTYWDASWVGHESDGR